MPDSFGTSLEKKHGHCCGDVLNITAKQLDESLAARPSVPEQGQAQVFEHLLDLYDHDALLRDDLLRASAALAASRSEAQPPSWHQMCEIAAKKLCNRCFIGRLRYKDIWPESAPQEVKKERYLHDTNDVCGADDFLREMDKEFGALLDAGAPAAGSAERWHTGLPDADGKYIVNIVWWAGGRPKGQQRNEEVQTDIFENGAWRTWPKFVTHWKPMPKSPALAGTDTDVAKEKK